MLVLPLVSADGAREVALPSPNGRLPAPELAVRGDAWHRTEREHLTGRVAVAIGQTLTTRTPVPDVVLDVEQRVEASTTPTGPPAIEGHCTLRAQTAGGEIAVRAELRVEHGAVVAGGEVSLDGELMLRRRWDARPEREEEHTP